MARTETVTFSASGSAVIQIGPKAVREEWIIRTVNVSTTSDPDLYSPRMDVYRNGHQQIGGTFSANLDTSSGETHLRQNEFIRFVLSGGEPGRQAMVSVDGTLRAY